MTVLIQSFPERGRPRDFLPRSAPGVGRHVFVRVNDEERDPGVFRGAARDEREVERVFGARCREHGIEEQPPPELGQELDPGADFGTRHSARLRGDATRTGCEERGAQEESREA